MPQELSTFDQIEHQLILSDEFVPAALVDNLVPDSTGLYCLRLRTGSVLPNPYEQELKRRLRRLLYIGKAAPAKLRERLLRQELGGRNHGTFFRSVGTMLGFHPRRGSLKIGRCTFKFTGTDATKIIEWINSNIEVCWLTHSDPEPIEKKLIGKYKPILNILNNPESYSHLESQRKQNIDIGRNRRS